METKIIRDRRIAEMMIEDIFLSRQNSYILVDYADIRAIRRQNTFRFMYSYDMELKEIGSWQLTLQDASLTGMSYCAMEIAYSKDMSIDMMSNLMRRIHGALENTRILNCSHMSADTAENRVRMNLYFFSPKSVENVEDREMDRRAEIIIENYCTIYSPSMIENVIEPGGILNYELEINLIPNEPDADLRLASYTRIISHLTVNDDSACWIKKLVDEAVDKLEEDIGKGRSVKISTLQHFVCFAGNQWIHLKGYYSDDDLKPTALRWSQILREMKINSPGYLKEAEDFADALRKIWIEDVLDDEFNFFLCKSKELAIKGNDTNRADIFSALEHLCRDAHYVQDSSKCIASAELAIEIASQGNEEIVFCKQRIKTFEELISRNRAGE